MKLENVGILNGFKIIEDTGMVEFYTEKVKRTFKERLFSFHWFTKLKTINKSRPDNQIIRYEDKLIMHPKTKDRVLKALEANK